METNFGFFDRAVGVRKVYIDTILTEGNEHLLHKEKEYNEFKLSSKKHSEGKVLTERVVKSTIHILFEKGLFENYDIALKVLKNYFLGVVDKKRRPCLDPVNDVIHAFCSLKQLEKSNIKYKNQSNLSFFMFENTYVFLRDGPFSTKIEIVRELPTKRTH